MLCGHLRIRGKSDIGDQINKKILGPLASANKLSDMPDFNDPKKLGSGKEMVGTLTGRIRQLAERYANSLPQLTSEVEKLATRVDGHLNKMGF